VTASGQVPEVDPSAAARELEEGAVALDVREDDEWDAGHIAGALHVPVGELGARLAEVPKDRVIVAVCRSGNRSAHVALALARAGYRARNLAGGMKAWKRAGLPIEPTDGFIA
jgi:rhodanese-related sulfurtransferase